MRARSPRQPRREPDPRRRGDGDDRRSSRCSSPTTRTTGSRSCPPTGSRPRSRTRSFLVTGNEVRVGGVRVGVDRDDRARSETRTEAVTAPLDLKLDSDVEPLPGRLDDDRPGALGARPQVPGDRQGGLERGLSAGAVVPESSYGFGSLDGGDCASADELPRAKQPCLQQPVDIDEVFNTFDEPTPGRDPEEPGRVRQRARRPRDRAQRRDRAPAAGGRLPRTGDAQPLRPRYGPRALRHRQRRRGRRGRSGRRIAGAISSSHSTPPSPRSPKSPAPTSRRRSRRPRRPSMSAPGRCRRSARSSTTAPTCSRRRTPASTRSARTLRRSRGRSRTAPRCSATRRS